MFCAESVRPFGGAGCDADHSLLVAEVWQGLSVVKLFDTERFRLKKYVLDFENLG
jgi:hypothetical protein